MNFFRTFLGTVLAFAILAAVTIGAALLFVPGPHSFNFYFILAQILAGEFALMLFILRGFSTAHAGATGPSGVAQQGSYRIFAFAYAISLVMTIAYFGFVRQTSVSAVSGLDFAFYGVQLLVIGLPLVVLIMAETSLRFVEQPGQAEAALKDRAGETIQKAVAALEDTILWAQPKAREAAATGIQRLEMAHRSLKSAVAAKLGMKSGAVRDIGGDLDGVIGRLRRAAGEDRDLNQALIEAAEDVTRIAARL
jgi:hypothetical protein